MDTQKIVTLDGFSVHVDPWEHFVKKNVDPWEHFVKKKKLQMFEVVQGPRGPRISILGLRSFETTQIEQKVEDFVIPPVFSAPYQNPNNWTLD